MKDSIQYENSYCFVINTKRHSETTDLFPVVENTM